MGAWIEDVNLHATREVRITYLPALSSVSLLADSNRVAIRLSWQFPASMENPGPGSGGDARLCSVGPNNGGLYIARTIMGITQHVPQAEMLREVYGPFMTGQFTV